MTSYCYMSAENKVDVGLPGLVRGVNNGVGRSVPEGTHLLTTIPHCFRILQTLLAHCIVKATSRNTHV